MVHQIQKLTTSNRDLGSERNFKKINGMFAFALWNKTLKKLYLARDRFGEKPYIMVG